MLAADPAQRFSSYDDLVAELERAWRELGIGGKQSVAVKTAPATLVPFRSLVSRFTLGAALKARFKRGFYAGIAASQVFIRVAFTESCIRRLGFCLVIAAQAKAGWISRSKRGIKHLPNIDSKSRYITLLKAAERIRNVTLIGASL